MMSICDRQFTRIKNRELNWVVCYPANVILGHTEWEPFDDTGATFLAAIYKEHYGISLNKEKIDKGLDQEPPMK